MSVAAAPIAQPVGAASAANLTINNAVEERL